MLMSLLSAACFIGAQHILRVAELELLGHDSTLARSLLVTFRRTQAQHVTHRD
jgi:hypothetical protein